MTTKTTVIIPMAADNPFGIKNVEDYAQIDVTTSEGGAAATLSTPWVQSLPYTDKRVQEAILKCKEMGENIVAHYIKEAAAREAAMTRRDKIARFFRRMGCGFKKALDRTKNIW